MDRNRDSHRVGGIRATAPAFIAAAGLMSSSQAQLAPERLYYGVGRPAPMTIRLPEPVPEAAPRIVLYEARTGRRLADAAAAAGRVDLAAMFPQLARAVAASGDSKDLGPPAVLAAQLEAGDEAIGAPVILQPMTSPAPARDGLTDALLAAFERGSLADLGALVNLPPAERARLKQKAVVPARGAAAPALAGWRAWIDRAVILDTTAGPIELALRPGEAPNTCFHFLSLVDGGFYTDVAFHRVVSSGPGARPFIVQAGDPIGSGAGGPGFVIDFESSSLRHDFGVVSLARRPDDPNSGGSQFFIALSREACAALDGQYVSFAQVVRGGEALQTIAASPVGPADPSDPASPRDRPLQPIRITSARSAPAPPFGTGPRPLRPEDVKPVER